MITINNQTVQELSKQFDVPKSVIYRCFNEGKYQGLSDDDIIINIEHYISHDLRLQRTFSKYVRTYIKKILLNFDNQSERKKIKEMFFKEWVELGLPISRFELEKGWNRIVTAAYYD